jgi:hypothetical protein
MEQAYIAVLVSASALSPAAPIVTHVALGWRQADRRRMKDIRKLLAIADVR